MILFTFAYFFLSVCTPDRRKTKIQPIELTAHVTMVQSMRCHHFHSRQFCGSQGAMQKF